MSKEITINEFVSDILKIPNGNFVQTFELERQTKIYNEYLKLGKADEYSINIGLLQVLR